MTIPWQKSLFVFFISLLLLIATVPVHAHTMPIGGSKWCLGKNGMVATLDLNQFLLAEIKEIKEGHLDLAASSDAQLQQIATDILQPYINKRLSISVNGKIYPAKVTRLLRKDKYQYTIWLSVDKLTLNKPENVLKIDYRLLFEETNNAHLNLAFFYKTDASGDALQKIFDFSQADGQFPFDNDSPVWELSIKGAIPEPSAPHATAAAQLVGAPNQTKDRKITTQRTVAVLPEPAMQPDIAIKGDAAASTSASAYSTSIASQISQQQQAADNKGSLQASAGTAAGSSGSIWPNIGRFILLGIEHILTGYDHIAFLIGLIVIGLSIRDVLKIITAFTIAHSITLLLAALQIISLNSQLVESVIAISICYIALENLFRKEVKYRWLITFCFGLIHGFGFASALQELIVGKTNLILSVVSFNFGVETGQLLIFFVLLPVLHLLKQKMDFRKVTAGVSLAILALGVTWLIERLFDLKLISS